PESLLERLERLGAADEVTVPRRQVGDLRAQPWEARFLTGHPQVPGPRARERRLSLWPARGRTPSSRRVLAVCRLRPTRSTYTRVRSRPGGWTCSTRTGRSSPCSPVGSLARATR